MSTSVNASIVLAGDRRVVGQRAGYRACVAGEVIRIPGVMNQALVGWVKYQPRWLVRALTEFVSRGALSRS